MDYSGDRTFHLGKSVPSHFPVVILPPVKPAPILRFDSYVRHDQQEKEVLCVFAQTRDRPRSAAFEKWKLKLDLEKGNSRGRWGRVGRARLERDCIVGSAGY